MTKNPAREEEQSDNQPNAGIWPTSHHGRENKRRLRDAARLYAAGVLDRTEARALVDDKPLDPDNVASAIEVYESGLVNLNEARELIDYDSVGEDDIQAMDWHPERTPQKPDHRDEADEYTAEKESDSQ